MSTKVWFITGCSSGFGRHMTELVLKNGGKVIATVLEPSALAELSTYYPISALLVLQVDVTKPQQILDAFAGGGKHFGRIDVVFNNAGYGVSGEVEGTPETIARDLFDVNFWGAVNVTKEAVRFFREVNKPAGGQLLQNSSLLGLEGGLATGFYSASKFALEGVSESLAAELDPKWNIKITIIEPGWHRTDVVGKALVRTPLHPAYDSPSLPVTSAHKQLESHPVLRGDPSKSVKMIYKLTALSDPPLHFPLGKDCIEVIRRKTARLLADAETYESWSEGLEFEE